MSTRSRSRLLVVSHPSVVSANQAVYAELARIGWETVVVLPDRWRHEYAAEEFSPEEHAGLEGRLRPVRIAFAGRPQRHIYLARVRRLLRELQSQIVFIEAESFSVAAWQWGLASVRARIPFGVQAEENLDRRLPLPARAIRRAILPRAAFIATRSSEAGRLARAWGARGEMAFVPHGVPAWDVTARPGDHPFTIGFAGRFVREKGVLDLVAAAGQLSREARLLLVGDGPLRSEIERRAHDVLDLVVRTDVPHERMAEAYAQMDVLVLPSRTTPRWAEQFGRVITEALSCGVPVIGSDSGEIPWMIERTGGGLVYPEGDVGALAARIEQLAGDDGLRTELARRGQEAVERELTVHAAALALDRLLLAALSA